MAEAPWLPPILVGRDGGPLTPLDDLHRYRLPIGDTYPLLDLQACISDLDSVIAIGDVLAAQAREGTFDFDLWHALVITYGRSFQKGKSYEPGKGRAGLRQFLPLLDAEQMSDHEDLIRVRNSQVAHAVANGGAAITVSFYDDGRFAGIDAFHTGESVTTAELQNAVSLARALRLLAWTERDRLKEELERQWSGRSLSPEELENAVNARKAYVAAKRAHSGSPADS